MDRRPLFAGVLLLAVFAEAPGRAQCPPYDCGKNYTTYRLYWLQREVHKDKLELKETVNPECRPTWKLDWQKAQHVRCELVLKPREILKEVTCCTMKPVTETDPYTGCQVMVLKPVTEVKQVKEIVFDLCPEEKTVYVQTPCLLPDVRTPDVKRLHLEPGSRKVREEYPVLVPCQVSEHVIYSPPPCVEMKKPAGVQGAPVRPKN